MKESDKVLSAILMLAAAEPIGVLLRCSDVNRAKQRLYQLKSKIPGGESLQIRVCPDASAGDLVICQRKVRIENVKEI